MKPMNTIPEWISEKLLGTLDPQNEARLRQWMEEHPENRQLAEELQHKAFLEVQAEKYAAIDTEKAYGKIRKQIRRNEKRIRFRKLTAIAAASAVLIAVGAWMWGSRSLNPTPQAELILPGTRTATLLTDESVVVSLEGDDPDLAGVEGISLLDGNSGISYVDQTGKSSPEPLAQEIRYNTLMVPRGGKYCVVLSDGTEVHLNSQSELRFPVQFTGTERRVFLTGEAYFNVERDPEKPFIVEISSGAEVSVLGTRFNVRDYREEPQQVVTLEQGRVAYETFTGKVELEAGEQLIAEENGSVTKQPVDTELFTSWKQGLFAFRDIRLEELLTNMSRWYDIEIVWHDPSLKEILFSGRIYDYHDFHSVIRMLEATGNNRFHIDGRIIHVYQ